MYCNLSDLKGNSRKFGVALWRNGGASDSRSEGCVFNSRRGQIILKTGSQMN